MIPFTALFLLAALPLSGTEIPIDGRVRDPGGTGLAGVRVELRPDGRAGAPEARAVTGGDGLFELRAPARGPWEVEVRAEGFVPMRFRIGALSGPFSVPPVKLHRDAGVRVRVQDPEGRPLAGAGVHAEPVRLWGDIPWPGWTPVPRTGTTGRDGAVRLPSSRGELLRIWAAAPGLPVREGPEARAPGEAVVRLERGTLHPAEARDSLPGPARTQVPAPQLPTGSLVGTVMDEEGKPAAGAEVRAIVDGLYLPEEAGRQGRVSPQGEVRIDGLGFGVAYDLVVTGPGFSPLFLKLHPLTAKESRFKIMVRRGRSVTGEIVDSQGRPAADAEVRLIPRVDENQWADDAPAREEIDRRTPTDPEGRFTLAEVPAGWYELLVQRPGFATARRGGIEVPEGGGLVDLGRLALPDGEVLTGRTLDPEGKALAGVEVWIRTEDDDIAEGWPPWPTAVSGPDGTFTIGGLPAGTSAWLDLCRTGFVPLKKPLSRIFPEPVPLVLQPAGYVTGRVTGPDGEPVAGYSVGASQGDPSPSHPSYPCVTQHDDAESDAAGRFRLGPLAPGWYYVTGLGEMAVAAGETREVRIELKPGEGRRSHGILDSLQPEGPATAIQDTADAWIDEPSPGKRGSAVIAGRLLGLEPAELAQARIGIGGPGTQLVARGTVEPDGSYRIDGLFPDDWDVYAETADRRLLDRVRIPPGETRITRDLVFEPVTELRGRVTGIEGEPVARAEITVKHQPEHIYDTRRYPFRTRTRNDGSFALRVPDGKYAVQAEKDGWFPAGSGPVSTRWDRSVDIRMQRAVRLTGRLLGLSPGEIPAIEAKGSREDADSLEGQVEVDGLYSISGLGAGTWDVEAELHLGPSERRTARAQVEIPWGATAQSVDLDFFMGDLSLSGRVHGGEGRGAIWVDLAHADGTPLIETAPIQDGAFHLDRLQAGSYRLRVETYDREVKVLAERTVQLPAREEVVVELAPE